MDEADLAAFLSGGGGCSLFPSFAAGSPPSVSAVPLREKRVSGRKEEGREGEGG